MHRSLVTLGAIALLVPIALPPATLPAVAPATAPSVTSPVGTSCGSEAPGSSGFLEPGQTTPGLIATICSAVTEGPGSDPSCGVCVPTDCEGLVDNEAHASVVTPGFPLGLGRRVATCTLKTDFSVSATPQTMDNALASSINYDIEWRGFWLVVAALDIFDSVQEMTIQINVYDVTQAQFVKYQLIHKTTLNTLGIEDIFEGATKLDSGNESGVIDISLKRGHAYEIHFVLRVESSANLGAVVDIDYGSFEHGAKWNSLTVTAGVDSMQLLDELHRVTIEGHLKNGDMLASLYLPVESGGQLESVLNLVDQLIADSAQAGLNLHNSPFWMSLARSERSLGHYRTAYERASKAYRLLTDE